MEMTSPLRRPTVPTTTTATTTTATLTRTATTATITRERERWPPLTAMLLSGEMSGEPPRDMNLKERFEIWMVNDGWRTLTLGLFVLLHGMVFAFGMVTYSTKDSLNDARGTFGFTFAVARAAALVLHVDVALILLPVCRTLISYARQTPLNGIIQFDKNIAFHKLVGWSIVVFSWIHTIAHMKNFAELASQQGLGARGFFLINVTTGPGWSGWLMLICLMAMVITSLGRFRRANFERFWYTHHLFVVFFLLWSVHGAFCMIKPDFPPLCSGIAVFWRYWIAGGVLYVGERAMREVRGHHRTYISKVVQHPSNVVEIQMKKEHTKTRPGQYVMLCCPEVSVWQYHPFTLTSAPEEDYLSVHIRCVGNFTHSLAKALGCKFDKKGRKSTTSKRPNPPSSSSPSSPTVVGVNAHSATDNVDPKLRRVLPRIYIDGPFGSASEDVFKYEVAVLVGAGIGATPFASVLKSIWYRMNYPQQKARLRKVYFFWVCRDFGSFEWFRSLLLAIEAQDKDNRIEIHTYITAQINPDDATNIMINDADAEQDAITGLRSPTNFGRPNWDVVFRSIRKIHAPAEVGVFYCGPKPLASVLHVKCNMYSEPGFHFVWGKENF